MDSKVEIEQKFAEIQNKLELKMPLTKEELDLIEKYVPDENVKKSIFIQDKINSGSKLNSEEEKFYKEINERKQNEGSFPLSRVSMENFERFQKFRK